MRIAIVGCGYVADLYMKTLKNYPQLEVAGVMDRHPERLSRFARHFGVRALQSLPRAGQACPQDPSPA